MNYAVKYSVAPVLILCFLTLACNQDPYADKSKEIQNGEPAGPREKPSPEIGDIKIESDSPFFYFEEGTEGSAGFTAHVTIKDVKYRLGAQNLADFPGSYFDEAHGKFYWNPPVGTVGSSLRVTRNLVVEVITEATDQRPSTGAELIVPLTVAKKFSVPTVVSMENYKTTYSEGSFSTFKVVVNDVDGVTSGREVGVLELRVGVRIGE